VRQHLFLLKCEEAKILKMLIINDKKNIQFKKYLDKARGANALACPSFGRLCVYPNNYIIIIILLPNIII